MAVHQERNPTPSVEFDEHLPNAQEETDALTELIAPPDLKMNDATDNSTICFFAPVERHSVLARQLDRMSRTRPLILWIDDIQFA